ncbi:hypothetical protein E1B28_011273 [Marasmius oreades]|uniref:Uncharacterized protein n=1 Tax=Marasmius oreades TaxID=181124 RepID=A0A9P7RTX5_9AGAR|nr:uncharacterized protein E1B28_011273 [Marasmius oreades]KAG7089607.1 hypothetical protein E1B28_011273 [Marasmius oreades]
MFVRFAVQLITVATLAITTSASPLVSKPAQVVARGSHSFNDWGGYSSLSNFDDFYGSDDFCHAHVKQTVIQKEQQVVCHSQSVEIIQQRLVVLQEMAKKIITEQICEVETQTIVFSQYHSSLGNFYDDLRRHSGLKVGYDDKVAGKFGDIVGSDGSISTQDLGFKGTDVGSNVVEVGGSNWDDKKSPDSVDSAFFAAQGAKFGL